MWSIFCSQKKSTIHYFTPPVKKIAKFGRLLAFGVVINVSGQTFADDGRCIKYTDRSTYSDEQPGMFIENICDFKLEVFSVYNKDPIAKKNSLVLNPHEKYPKSGQGYINPDFFGPTKYGTWTACKMPPGVINWDKSLNGGECGKEASQSRFPSGGAANKADGSNSGDSSSRYRSNPNATQAKDPDKDYSGESCAYFTKPAVREDGGGLNYHISGATVAYGKWVYRCDARRWVRLGPSSTFDGVDRVKAEVLEWSKIDSKLYEPD